MTVYMITFADGSMIMWNDSIDLELTPFLKNLLTKHKVRTVK